MPSCECMHNEDDEDEEAECLCGACGDIYDPNSFSCFFNHVETDRYPPFLHLPTYPSPSTEMTSGTLEHVPLHSKSLCKNSTRLSGGCK